MNLVFPPFALITACTLCVFYYSSTVREYAESVYDLMIYFTFTVPLKSLRVQPFPHHCKPQRWHASADLSIRVFLYCAQSCPSHRVEHALLYYSLIQTLAHIRYLMLFGCSPCTLNQLNQFSLQQQWHNKSSCVVGAHIYSISTFTDAHLPKPKEYLYWFWIIVNTLLETHPVSKVIVLVLINDENKESLWWSLELHCCWPAPRQSVWSRVRSKVGSIHCVFACCCFPAFLWLTLSPLVLSQMAHTVGLMDTYPFGSLASRWAGRLVPVAVVHCILRPAEYICCYRLPVQLWCNQPKRANTGSGVPPSCVHLHHFFLPQSTVISLKVGGVFSRHLLHLCLPRKPQGLNRLSLREKTQTHTPASHLCVLFLWSFLEG